MNYNPFGFALAAIIVAGCTRQPSSPTPSSDSAEPAKNGAPFSTIKATPEETLAAAIALMAEIDDSIDDNELDEDAARRFRARFRGQLAAAGIDADTVTNWVAGN